MGRGEKLSSVKRGTIEGSLCSCSTLSSSTEEKYFLGKIFLLKIFLISTSEAANHMVNNEHSVLLMQKENFDVNIFQKREFH